MSLPRKGGGHAAFDKTLSAGKKHRNSHLLAPPTPPL